VYRLHDRVFWGAKQSTPHGHTWKKSVLLPAKKGPHEEVLHKVGSPGCNSPAKKKKIPIVIKKRRLLHGRSNLAIDVTK
jgi:hypothetical protein